VLKLAHKFTGAGMNLIGSAHLSIGKLDAMWSVPAWADLSLLPSTGEINFWGTFYNGPLDTTEKIGAFLLAAWVLQGAVRVFVSYSFARTQMYFCSGSVDATDYDDFTRKKPPRSRPRRRRVEPSAVRRRRRPVISRAAPRRLPPPEPRRLNRRWPLTAT
jgi:hypothetical protein